MAATAPVRPGGLRVIHGDAVQALQQGYIDILGHQVNLRGVMGTGIAKQIKNVYPTVFSVYRETVTTQDLALGSVQLIRVGPSRWVANIAGQDGYGSGRQTDYAAFRTAIQKLADLVDGTSLRVGLPYGIGCGHAGGSWSTIERILLEELPEATLYRLGGAGHRF